MGNEAHVRWMWQWKDGMGRVHERNVYPVINIGVGDDCIDWYTAKRHAIEDGFTTITWADGGQERIDEIDDSNGSRWLGDFIVRRGLLLIREGSMMYRVAGEFRR